MLNIPRYKEDAVAHLPADTEPQHLPERVHKDALKNFGLALLGSGQIVEAESSLLG